MFGCRDNYTVRFLPVGLWFTVHTDDHVIPPGEPCPYQASVSQLRVLEYVVAGYAKSADEAPGQTKELNPDLILMDINLNNRMDEKLIEPFSMLERSNIPLIFLTSSSPEFSMFAYPAC
jgi:AmiR/NasT family two-component response regulator